MFYYINNDGLIFISSVAPKSLEGLREITFEEVKKIMEEQGEEG